MFEKLKQWFGKKPEVVEKLSEVKDEPVVGPPEPTVDDGWTTAMKEKIALYRLQESEGATEHLRLKAKHKREALEYAIEHP